MKAAVIADSDKDTTDNESHQSRFSWLELLIVVPGRTAVSCSDEQRRAERGEEGGVRGGLDSFPDHFPNVV